MLDGFTAWPEEFAQRYREAGFWSGQSLGGLPGQWAARFGDRVAVVAGDERWSFGELDVRSGRLAAGFRASGITSGDRVVVQLPNVAEFFEVLFALFKVGAVPVVVLPAYRRSEVSYFCRFTEAVAYVVADQHAGFDFRVLAAEVRQEAPTLRHVFVVGDPGEFCALDTVREVAPEGGAGSGRWPGADPADVALLHLSGGTTGVPKLIPRTHDDYLYGARASVEVCGFGPATVYLCSLPVAHQFSLSAPGALGAFLSGGRVVLGPHPAPDAVFALIEREEATVAAVVPPVAALWLQAAEHTAHDLSSLELLQVGGAKLSPQLAREVRPVLGCRVQQVFALLAERARRATGLDALCPAGGAALNCSSNGLLPQPVYVPPVPHDAGVALGAAWAIAPPRTPAPALDPYLGRAITASEIDRALSRHDATTRPFSPDEVGNRLLAGEMGAVVTGRAEVGPRALCHRSIIALPQDPLMRDRLNLAKGRELLRPLSPVGLPEAEDTCWTGKSHPAPLHAWRCQGHRPRPQRHPGRRPRRRHGTPSEHHQPGRTPLGHPWPPSASRRAAGIDQHLLQHRGEPIVDTADGAIHSARAIGLDFLILGDRIVELSHVSGTHATGMRPAPMSAPDGDW